MLQMVHYLQFFFQLCDGALLAIPARDRHWDTLALLVKAEDDELTRLRVLRRQRRFYLEETDRLRLVQKSLRYYFIHLLPPYLIRYVYTQFYILPHGRNKVKLFMILSPVKSIANRHKQSRPFLGGSACQKSPVRTFFDKLSRRAF